MTAELATTHPLDAHATALTGLARDTGGGLSVEVQPTVQSVTLRLDFLYMTGEEVFDLEINGEPVPFGRCRYHVSDQFDLLSPDIDRTNFLFLTALKGSAMETGGGGWTQVLNGAWGLDLPTMSAPKAVAGTTNSS